MKELFFTSILTFFGANLFAQVEPLDVPTDLKELIEIENSLGSINKGFKYFNPYYDEDFDDIYDVWPNVKKKTLIFRRTTDNFYPHLHSWYFFDQDSTVKLVHYRWGFANTELEISPKEIRNQVNRKNEYLEKYRAIKKNLIAQFETPNKEDEIIETDSYVTYKSIWENQEFRLVLVTTVDKIPVEFEAKGVGLMMTPRSMIEIKLLMKEK